MERAVRKKGRDTAKTVDAKAQLNVYMATDAIDHLRSVAVSLAGTHTLGDIVQRLVDDHLEAAAAQLRSEGALERLPVGRRVGRRSSPS